MLSRSLQRSLVKCRTKIVLTQAFSCPRSGSSLRTSLLVTNHHQQAPGLPSSGKTTDYAFEMAVSNIRYGAGVTNEVGMDLQNMGAKNVCLMTDKNLSQLPPVKIVMDSLVKNGINFQVYDNVRVEPTDTSFMDAIEFAKKGAFDAYVAVGGGSTMDTCKAANLYASSPQSEFLDYVNAPIGKGKPVCSPLKPLIAVPTTSGTGSETTGVAIFDYEHLKVKTGIASRAIKPTLGLVDPLHTLHMPGQVVANSGFDVLCHALESYTALPYHMRSPCPSNPISRPAYQGSNPISDIWSVQALRIVAKYLKRAVRNPDDLEARSNMHLASAFAGIGFGNAGVHLCPMAFLWCSHPQRCSRSRQRCFQNGTWRQQKYWERVTKLAPRPQSEEDLSALFEASMKLY
ncbi:hydroxyacid-oxoacid transhydrogenase, mitochondrial isoform X4 [Heterocephalus glaber]|uniref:Hydroxyacid-oxoacid transhydrogenase, mitochondrial n=1 Tax=Heterocephalus glaber TaxID=10181 RepID=A0AAX6P2L1_HETGA|nr:hydroxyacid-oxoacid transhydrogenase, mitochondrial isoform X4 [Heterocephalus glaber]